ncbi:MULTISPECIES: UbiH/UbiF/VisC/COQ6 family ubiquinone biosynthesis hydroxylase [Thiorhodovibrio]|uniref:UbiH/UbiF/VisC/COQ6 family ubiquinone biosynthesis hydroxylase n=1 Tax=Thiorhodovibrio TaxID=61593 RepID=UPI00191221D3|nr:MULTISPECIES: UbiH/UbiF/VisC/COQ6 family ubiquinone biosynthesis hydroxylase [Thiorhodovibrio]MBK5969683.1 2-octaprenyl-3-methyl-6-methoxy-1,4-benzoquinol hydroxylase [Thiorhodovibrio winogradskyi]WPL14537.1 2-octaprenyl-3-methyl-6-methoxy-1,4-benzoquinol hydroxylase [Thiorhodovibrio litoralis]
MSTTSKSQAGKPRSGNSRSSSTKKPPQTKATASHPTQKSGNGPEHFDLVIVGGGMVGAALACACRDLDLRIAVIDGQPPRRDWPAGEIDLRVSALSRASERLLRRLGAWPRMQELGVSPYREMVVWDQPENGPGRGELHFDSATLGEPDLGHIVENRVTRLALWEQLGEQLGEQPGEQPGEQLGQQLEQASDLRLLCPATMQSLTLEPDQVRLQLDDGSSLTATLLVGADGRESRVRAAIGIGCDTMLYDQRAIVAAVEPAHWHRETAWQRFLPTGPLAFLPLADGRCSIVWSATQERAEELLAMDDLTFSAELEQAFDQRLGKIRSVGPRASFGLLRSHAMRYFNGRAALIGDAAHAIHPLAGQGVNLGFLDVAALYDALAHARRRGRDIASPAILRRYERARRTDNQQMLLAMDAIKRLFSNANPVLAAARGLGLNAVDHLPPLKQGFIREAMGLGSHLPSLARR